MPELNSNLGKSMTHHNQTKELTTWFLNSRASHDFVSKVCTEKHQLDVHHGNTPYMISTPGVKIVTRHIARKTPLNVARKVFKVCLIVLDGQGIDVILGMGWIKRHKALLEWYT
jgi:hypothetical protein